MLPKRAEVISRMVDNYYKLSELRFSVISHEVETNKLTRYEKSYASLREYLESIGLSGDELDYGLGLQR